MKIDQQQVYAKLTHGFHGHVVMLLTKGTIASRVSGFVTGDHFLGARATKQPITIEDCVLTPEQFRQWRTEQGLTIEACAKQYSIPYEAMMRYEGTAAT